MNRVLRNSFTFLMLLFASLWGVHANAQEQDFAKFHFDSVVALPGHLLMPGDYVFRVLDPGTSQNTIEVVSADGSEMVGYFQVISSQRQNDADTTVALSSPDSYGLRRIQDWYVAGNTTGYEFTYSPSDVQKLDEQASNLSPNQNAVNGK